MKERLVELIKSTGKKYEFYDCTEEEALELLAENLLENGVIVPPDELYSIVDKGTIYATVSKAMVDWLPLYVIKEPEKYGYYKTREQAQAKLKEGAGNEHK